MGDPFSALLGPDVKSVAIMTMRRELGLPQKNRRIHRCPLLRAKDWDEKKLGEENFIVKERHGAVTLEASCSYSRSVFLVAFSPCKEYVASTHGDHNVYVSEIKTGKCVRKLAGHPRTPWTLAFHPTLPNVLASGCLGGTVRIWDIKSGESESWACCKNGEIAISSLTFHHVDPLLVIGANNELIFWDWSRWKRPRVKICTHSDKEKVRYVKFDPLGKSLITGISHDKREATLTPRPGQADPVPPQARRPFYGFPSSDVPPRVASRYARTAAAARFRPGVLDLDDDDDGDDSDDALPDGLAGRGDGLAGTPPVRGADGAAGARRRIGGGLESDGEVNARLRHIAGVIGRLAEEAHQTRTLSEGIYYYLADGARDRGRPSEGASASGGGGSATEDRRRVGFAARERFRGPGASDSDAPLEERDLWSSLRPGPGSSGRGRDADDRHYSETWTDHFALRRRHHASLRRRMASDDPYGSAVARGSLFSRPPAPSRPAENGLPPGPAAAAESDAPDAYRAGTTAGELDFYSSLAQIVDGYFAPGSDLRRSPVDRPSPPSAEETVGRAAPADDGDGAAAATEEREARQSVDLQLQVYEESIREGYRQLDERSRQLRVLQRLERIYRQFEHIQERQARDLRHVRQEIDLQRRVLRGRDEGALRRRRARFQSHVRRLFGPHVLARPPGEPETPEEVLKRQEEKLQQQFDLQEQLKVEIQKLMDAHRNSLVLRRNEAQQRRDLRETSELFDRLVARLPPEDRVRAQNNMRLIRADGEASGAAGGEDFSMASVLNGMFTKIHESRRENLRRRHPSQGLGPVGTAPTQGQRVQLSNRSDGLDPALSALDPFGSVASPDPRQNTPSAEPASLPLEDPTPDAPLLAAVRDRLGELALHLFEIEEYVARVIRTGEPFEAAGVALVAQAVFDAEWPVTQMHESAEKYMRRLDRVSGNGSADDDRGRIPVAPDPLPTDPPSGDVNALLLRARRLAGALRATLVRVQSALRVEEPGQTFSSEDCLRYRSSRMALSRIAAVILKGILVPQYVLDVVRRRPPDIDVQGRGLVGKRPPLPATSESPGPVPVPRSPAEELRDLSRRLEREAREETRKSEEARSSVNRLVGNCTGCGKSQRGEVCFFCGPPQNPALGQFCSVHQLLWSRMKKRNQHLENLEAALRAARQNKLKRKADPEAPRASASPEAGARRGTPPPPEPRRRGAEGPAERGGRTGAGPPSGAEGIAGAIARMRSRLLTATHQLRDARSRLAQVPVPTAEAPGPSPFSGGNAPAARVGYGGVRFPLSDAGASRQSLFFQGPQRSRVADDVVNAGAERDDDDEAEDAPPRPEGDRPYPDESFRARMMRMFEPYRLENQALWVEDRRPAHSSVCPIHRIQAWDWDREALPEIHDPSLNLVVGDAKIHNDASVDVSSDGRFLVAFLPARMSLSTRIGVFGLHPPAQRGAVYATHYFDAPAVSVALSPTNRHLVLGITLRSILDRSYRSMLAQIIRVRLPSEASESPGFQHRRNIYQTADDCNASVNCIKWLPVAGQGLLYALNNGCVRMLQ